MKKVLIVQSEVCTTDNYVACLAILRHCMIPHSIDVSVKEMMTLSKGTAHPANGFVMIPNNGPVMRNFMHLTRWIEEQGIMPI